MSFSLRVTLSSFHSHLTELVQFVLDPTGTWSRSSLIIMNSVISRRLNHTMLKLLYKLVKLA